MINKNVCKDIVNKIQKIFDNADYIDSIYIKVEADEYSALSIKYQITERISQEVTNNEQ